MHHVHSQLKAGRVPRLIECESWPCWVGNFTRALHETRLNKIFDEEHTSKVHKTVHTLRGCRCRLRYHPGCCQEQLPFHSISNMKSRLSGVQAHKHLLTLVQAAFYPIAWTTCGEPASPQGSEQPLHLEWLLGLVFECRFKAAKPWQCIWTARQTLISLLNDTT